MNKDSVQENRRTFLGKVGIAGAATLAAGIVGTEPILIGEDSSVQAAQNGSNQRANECAKLRRDAANAGNAATPANLQHPQNSDEDLYQTNSEVIRKRCRTTMTAPSICGVTPRCALFAVWRESNRKRRCGGFNPLRF